MPNVPPLTPRCRRGFTMIELLTVIGIIVILMGILIPVISAVQKMGQKTNTNALINRLATACNNYYQDFRAFPGPVPDYAVHGFNVAGASPSMGSNGIAFDISNGCKRPTQNIGTIISFAQYSSVPSNVDFSSSENLVLGLEGGLRPYNTAAAVSSLVNATYDPTLIPKGPMGLNIIAPITYPSYYDPKAGELSDDGNGNLASRTTSDPFLLSGSISGVASNPCSANLFVVPEFLDTFNIPRAIIYLRARPGAPHACDLPPQLASGTSASDAGSQYYSAEMDMYAPNFFTQVDPANNNTILYPANGLTGASQEYGFAFFANTSNQATNAAADTGACRSRDTFILISAGPDGLYGTKDDIVYSN